MTERSGSGYWWMVSAVDNVAHALIRFWSAHRRLHQGSDP